VSVGADAETASKAGLNEFWSGARDCLPVIVAAAPFGLLFGALAVTNGFTVFEAMLMSGTVYGGASPMVGIELFGQHIAPWLVVFSIFAVNFRHVLYSAVIGRRIRNWSFLQKAIAFFLLIDPQFAETERKSERDGGVTFAWYVGFGATIWVTWVTEAGLGAHFGGLISDPHALGIDFLLPIYFLGLVMGFRKRPLWLPVVIASAVASMIAYKTIGSPWHVSAGAVAGIALAAIFTPAKEKAARP
jgi:predicted branched-subunit amino acid permease